MFDAGSTFEGDLQIDSKGDVKLASSFDSQLAAANFWLRTDHADYAAATDIGANLGEYIGSQNTEETLEAMKEQTFDSLVRNLFYPEDIRVEAVPFDYEEAMVALEIKGEYIEYEGDFVKVSPQILTYLFPYIDGELFPTS